MSHEISDRNSASMSEELSTNFQDIFIRLVRYASSRWSDPEAVAQDTIEKILKSKQYQEQGKLNGYAFTIAHRLIINNYRKRRLETTELFEELPSYESSPEEEIVNNENRARMYQCIELLDPKYQAIVKLYLAGRSDTEIYQELGLKMKTYRTQKHRAIKQLTDLCHTDQT